MPIPADCANPDHRHQYQAQLSNIHTIREAKLAALSNPSAGASLRPALCQGPGASAGPQTLTSQWASGVLPPPRGTGVLPALASATLKPSIEEAVKAGAEPRSLEKFSQAERQWGKAATALAAATQRPQYDLAFQRGGLAGC